MHCQPAAKIIDALGGVNAVAEIAGVDLSRVVRWRLPKASGGTGGTIPQRHIPALLDRGRALGLTADDFLPPRAEPAPTETAA